MLLGACTPQVGTEVAAHLAVLPCIRGKYGGETEGGEAAIIPAGVMLRSMILPALLCDTRLGPCVVAGRQAKKKKSQGRMTARIETTFLCSFLEGEK